MFGYVGAPRTYRRTQAMARVAGVDLSAAVLDGWLRRDELSALMDRCEACAQSPACGGWHRKATAPALPDYCRVKPDLEALSPA